MYNPFVRPVDELEERDLVDTLPGKRETWIYEYKAAEKLDKQADIAKSIASFANTYGGWLFIGIEERADGEPELNPIQGISLNRGGLSERIYQICTSHLSPPPHLTCREAELKSNGSVRGHALAIHIPRSPNPPHISMSNGRVYVRSGNTTDPIDVVKDRSELDRLHDRAAENRGRLEELLSFHRRGELLLEAAVEANRDYSRTPLQQAVGFIAYPSVALPELWDFPTGDPLPKQVSEAIVTAADSDLACQWVKQFTGAGLWRWYDHNRCIAIGQADNSVFYVDRFGHIGGATMSRSKELSVTTCFHKLQQFAHVAEATYRDYGYFGSVSLICLLLLQGDNIRPPLSLELPALELASTVVAQSEEIRSNLFRLAGMADEW